jgi:hypothetical protein
MANGVSISGTCAALRDHYRWCFPDEDPPTVDPKVLGNVCDLAV